MPSIPFNAALEAFGGWPGLAAFYFVGLAFPCCYAFRRTQAHEPAQFGRRVKELRLASAAIYLSAALCFIVPSEIYLQRHVANDSQIFSRAADWTLGYAVVYILAPLIGFARVRRTIRADQQWLDAQLPDPRRSCSGCNAAARRLVTSTQTNLYAEQTWQLLFTLWFMNIASGTLTVCVGRIVAHDIRWWNFSAYNIGGHVALLHAVVGVVDALFMPFRTGSMELALQCESVETRDAHWLVVRESMRSARDQLKIILLELRPGRVKDLESDDSRWERRDSNSGVDLERGYVRSGISDCGKEPLCQHHGLESRQQVSVQDRRPL